MKKLILIPFFLFIINSLSANPFVHRDGKLLKDSTNAAIKLKGVNLGGWLLWEGWIWGGKLKSQSTIYSGIESTTSKKDADAFRDYVYKNFINEGDIQKISQLGLNVVRVPFNHRIFDTASCNAIGWQVMDSLLKWCAKYHVYAVLDMHAAYGGQNPYFIADPDKTILWKSEEAKRKTVVLWKKIAERYKNNPAVGGYDLLNEPTISKPEDLVSMYNRIIEAIRSVDKNHMIILEGNNFAKKFDFFKKLPDENMCFSFHIYTWLGGKPSDKIEPYTALANQLNVPMWCGEWGENTHEVIATTLATFAQPNSNVAGWCFWTWKKAPNGYTSLQAINVSAEWKSYITWCCKPNSKTKPIAEAAKKAISDFENAFLSKNMVVDQKLAGMLAADAGK
jgi:endoglucanase